MTFLVVCMTCLYDVLVLYDVFVWCACMTCFYDVYPADARTNKNAVHQATQRVPHNDVQKEETCMTLLYCMTCLYGVLV